MRDYELNYREKIVIWVWDRMNAIYPERWARVYGPVWCPKRERQRKKRSSLWPTLAHTAKVWADHLVKIDKDAIALGIERCESRREMPTLPEFVAMCKQDGHLRLRKPPPPPITPEAKAARDRAARVAFAQAKRVVGEPL